MTNATMFTKKLPVFLHATRASLAEVRTLGASLAASARQRSAGQKRVILWSSCCRKLDLATGIAGATELHR